MQLIQFSKNQHKILQGKIRKIIKLLLGSTISMPNLLLKKACIYPDTLKRNQYFIQKQRVGDGMHHLRISISLNNRLNFIFIFLLSIKLIFGNLNQIQEIFIVTNVIHFTHIYSLNYNVLSIMAYLMDLIP
eukprot:NODE_251_length_11743_cov_0.676788.p6 type:complete len:131 gc:universal NODE_251_length_11743_cov_0.676788:7890-8282(+)